MWSQLRWYLKKNQTVQLLKTWSKTQHFKVMPVSRFCCYAIVAFRHLSFHRKHLNYIFSTLYIIFLFLFFKRWRERMSHHHHHRWAWSSTGKHVESTWEENFFSSTQERLAKMILTDMFSIISLNRDEEDKVHF